MPSGAITTLGRGGSDLSATFLGAALGVCEVVIWKDVNGVLSADPRIVRDARVIDELTFDEATELAYFGAQVCQPRFRHVWRGSLLCWQLYWRCSKYHVCMHGCVRFERPLW